jgi:hypothetical protein|tara:strand:- start:383 stop:523 length:141 start_codon:yes stop_codon:yes gene_type:complete
VSVGAMSTDLGYDLYILYPTAHQALQVFAMYVTPHHNIAVTLAAAL